MCDYEIPLIYAHNFGQQYLPVSHGQKRIFFKIMRACRVQFDDTNHSCTVHIYQRFTCIFESCICIHYKNIDRIISETIDQAS